MNKVITNVETRINEIVANVEKEKSQLKQTIAEFESKADKTNNAMEQAVLSGNLEAYEKTKLEKEFCLESVEMAKRRFDLLKNKAIINDDEYKKLSDSLMSEMNKEADKLDEIFLECYDKMYKAKDEFCAIIEKGEKLSNTLQINLHKAYTHNVELRRWETVHLINYIAERENCRDLIRNRK